MDKILSDEELEALMSLWRSGRESTEDNSPGETNLIENEELQRRFFRLQQSLKATMTVHGNQYNVEATNIGLGGAFVLSEINLPTNHMVEISINLPNPKTTIHAKSRVCWQKKVGDKITGLGIRFASLDTDFIWMILANMKQAVEEEKDTQTPSE